MYEELARPGTTFLLSHKRNLREMTYTNWLTDFLSNLFMKIDNRINQGFFFSFAIFCFPNLQNIFYAMFFLITNVAFLQSDNFMHEGREFLDLWSNTCCECWRGKISLRASSAIWASEASLARTLRCSLARSRAARFARPNRRACSQAKVKCV